MHGRNDFLQRLFKRQAHAPTVDIAMTGRIVGHESGAFSYHGTALPVSLLHIRLDDCFGRFAFAQALVPGRHDPAVWHRQSVQGRLYPDRASYDRLLGRDDPALSFIHGYMLTNPGRYVDPMTLAIDGHGRPALSADRPSPEKSWFSGLIPRQKGVKPTSAINNSP